MTDLELQSPAWIRGALRSSDGTDRIAIRRLVHHLDVFLPGVAGRLVDGLWPGIDEPISDAHRDDLMLDVLDAYAFWADRERIAAGELWPAIALRYRSPRAFGAGRQESLVRIARRELPDCPRLRPAMGLGRRLPTPLVVALYLGSIVLANGLVAAFGPGVIPLVGFALIGLDLTLRDELHDRGRLRMGLVVLAGTALSWLVAPAVALASGVAFLAAAVADGVAYELLARRPRLARINGSNVAGAAVDSFLFPTLAFGAVLWPVVLASFAVKVAGGAVWAFLLTRRRFDEPEPWELDYQYGPDPEVDR